jgi:N6-L-threonylcarbamoyladenine synthase
MPYPGGPHIERAAAAGDPTRFRFSRPMVRTNARPGDGDFYDLSFSGLKTAVRLATQKVDIERERANLARGFQDALIDTLVEKSLRAARENARTRVVLGGGVACNRTLISRMRERLAEVGATVYAPSARLATDNAAMIARAGLFHFESGERASPALSAVASLPIPGSRPA